MKKSRGACFFACLLILGSSSLSASAQSLRTPVSELRVSIEAMDMDLAQTMDLIAQQLGINISLRGKNPDLKRDVFLRKVPLEKAVSELTWLYGIENHAAVYGVSGMTLTVFRSHSGAPVSVQLGPPSLDLWNQSPLTPAQWEDLKAESDVIVAEMKQSRQPLTPEQMGRLQEQSAAVEAGMNTGGKPLTPEKMERLQSGSSLIESKMKKSRDPLTPEQMRHLQGNSAQIDAEMTGKERNPLTAEQLQRLRELEPKD